MRRTPTWYNNAWEAGAGSLEAGAVYSEKDKEVYESTAPTASRWLSRLLLGEKQRIGVAIRKDEALTVDRILLIGEIVEEDWSKSNFEEEKKELEPKIAFSTIAFCVSLRVEEVPLIVIEGLNMFWKETQNHYIPRMMMTLKGRFKGGGNLWWYCVML